VRLLAEVSLGSGALALVGGTVGVIAFLTFFDRHQRRPAGLRGPEPARRRQLHRLHLGVLQHPRDRAAGHGLALSATVGAGFTAQLGAMRVSEEVDALEVMGIPSLPFLVTTRMIAGFIAVIPLYVIGLLSSYFAAR
jgi:phospholipid/cholesterol/gamma-HCH transport system permease protein